MLQHKDITILSEIKNFFTSEEKAIQQLFHNISSLRINGSHFGFADAVNNRYSNYSKLLLLLLYPFFQIKSPDSYMNSVLYKYLNYGKDVFYRLINNPKIDWRNLAYSINKQMIKKLRHESEPNENPRCIIIDDTDLPKKGRKIELIGKIFSHVTYTSLLGFKGLFMGYFDGKSFFGLDFSLHGEKGKNKKKPYGLTPKQIGQRYNKKRDKNSKGQSRVCEYQSTKIQSAIQMVHRAIKKGIRFDYLLIDSWFTCFEIVKFIKTRRIKCHILGMIKMGKTHYSFTGKAMTANTIAEKLQRSKKVKVSRKLRYYYSEVIVDFHGIKVKLFFCKASRKGTWNALLTTNTKLNFEQAYKIYSVRWTIEVFFKECKQHLALGKCQSQDFDAQIASTTICILQYNLLSVAKRLMDYQTTGDLFRNIQKDSILLTLNQRIWFIILEVATVVSKTFNLDTELFMKQLFLESSTLSRYFSLPSLSETG